MLANLLLLVIIVVVSLFLAANRLARNNPSALLYGLFFLFLGVVPLAFLFFDDQYSANIQIELEVNIIVFLILLFMAFGEDIFNLLLYHNTLKKGPIINLGRSFLLTPCSSLMLKRFVVFVSPIICIGFAYYVFSYNLTLTELLATGRMKLRLVDTGYLSTVISMVLPFTSVVIYACITMWHRDIFSIRFFFVAVVAVLLFQTLIFGARTSALLIASPFLWHFIKWKHDNGRLKLLLRKLSVVMIAGPIVLLFMLSFLHVLRWQENKDVSTLADVLVSHDTYSFLYTNTKSSDLFIRNKLVDAVKIFPSQHDWLYGNTYRSMLLFWLPSKYSLGLKNDTMYIYAFAKSGDLRVFTDRLSDHPTLLGDLYINFGPFFPVGAFLWGCCLSFVNFISNKYSKSPLGCVLGGIWCYFLIVSFRGSVYQPFFSIMVCLLVTGSLLLFYRTLILISREKKNQYETNYLF